MLVQSVYATIYQRSILLMCKPSENHLLMSALYPIYMYPTLTPAWIHNDHQQIETDQLRFSRKRQIALRVCYF